MELDEKDKKTLERKLALKGFSEYESAFFNTNDYSSLVDFFMHNLPKRNPIILNLPYTNIDKVLKSGKETVEKHTDGIDIRVPYVHGHYFNTYLWEQFGKSPDKDIWTDIVEYVFDNIDLKKVTEIPLEFDLLEKSNGSTSVTNFYGDKFDGTDFYKQLPLVISKIKLQGPVTDFGICTYVHEMYHALNYRNKGYTSNQLYNEVISIFMEWVTTMDLGDSRLQDLKILDRILATKRDILYREAYTFENKNPVAILDFNKYIISTLLAACLFEIYFKGNEIIRKEMDLDINSIFCSKYTLDDVLEKYEATPEKGCVLMKRMAKDVSHYQ